MSELSPEDLAKAVEAFKLRLLQEGTPLQLVRELITFGSAAVIPDTAYSSIRDYVGQVLKISPTRDVYIVGSAKLGFSIKPTARYRGFNDDSDFDLAIVSASLYQRLWEQARTYVRQGGIWDRDDRNHFKNDHLNGVIKPYLLPDSPLTSLKATLFDLSSTLQASGRSYCRVTMAVWHTMDALETYQSVAVQQCREELTIA
ncbi:hypothetical protein [Verrucosispora sp. NA02020]|uniref:hypothetical protein n=1 Tax=Verrucosispora sp. NA02020 TaxID=2742132 RepID=UPI003D7415D8